MTPSDLLEYVDVLRVLFGVSILMTYFKRAPEVSRRWFWFAVGITVVIGLLGLEPWVRNPTLSSWKSFGSLFQAMFNIAVAGVLVLRWYLYDREELRREI
jgi:hypothetical protein